MAGYVTLDSVTIVSHRNLAQNKIPQKFRTFASALENANWSVNALGFIKKVGANEVAEFNRMMSFQIGDDFSLESGGLGPDFLAVAFTYPETVGVLNPGEDLLNHPHPPTRPY